MKKILEKSSEWALSGLDRLARLDRETKKLIAFLADGLLCVLSVSIAFSLRLGADDFWNQSMAIVTVVAFSIWIPLFLASGIYKSIFRFAGSGTMIELVRVGVIFTAIMATIFTGISVPGIPRAIGFLVPLVFFLGLAMSRITVRYVINDLLGQHLFGGELKRILIFGAGEAGQQLALSMRHYPGMQLLGFVDDDKRLSGQKLDGIPIYDASETATHIKKLKATDLLLAVPEMNRNRRQKIVRDLEQLNVHVQTLPPVQDIVDGKVTIEDLREIEIDELLGREAVTPNALLMSRPVVGKTVMVTGAGGSIGSELCRQILAIAPKKLVLVEMTEHALYQIEQELREAMADEGSASVELVAELVNTTNGRAVETLFANYQPDTVFHAAAYKHVPLIEHNPIAGMANNILSTLNLTNAAERQNVARFILISTDKAVRPTNIMGATKRVCEQILQARAAEGSKTRFSMVRFGNVLGSSGSVVPRFKEQIAKGGPITLTHRDIIRYFMTIPEAAQLVIQAGGMAEGGEVFVLDMGKPVKIYDLACAMISLSGLTLRSEANPEGDIAIEEIGLRPGEKLFEELLIGDNPMPTKHKLIMQAREGFTAWEPLYSALSELERKLAKGDRKGALAILRKLVPEYAPDQNDVQPAPQVA